jgi:outer membrane protein assembly factor BamB
MLGYPGSGNPDSGYTTYMSIDANNRVYILYGKSSSSSSSTPAVVYCYDLTKYSQTDGATPEWRVELDNVGSVNRYYSHGTVLGADGTVYVTTRKGLTALDPANGSVKWTLPVSGDSYSIWGCPAVDNQGYVYFNESAVEEDVQTVGKLVKVSPDGTKASEIVLGTALRTSPTISPDGTIYCTGMKDGKVTLFAVRGSATGPAAGWSQLGGNPRKSCKAE